jgi:hypothetical protein
VRLAREPAVLNLGFGQNFEERSFAHLWQADNSGFHRRSVVVFVLLELSL